ncbi:MAG: Crp/Fnr family transcriptional regulator [Prevotella sp.]|nr:Crp/Fnr family transcriptional regulator [Prevotella sp.]MDY4039635.1 Crp/Fnr family transcriptional regulator [Prevotella sp.]
MEQKKIVETLAAGPLFKGLREGELELLLQSINYKIVEYKKNKLYTIEGDSYLHADLVLSGVIVPYMVGDSGKSVQMGKLSAGDLIAPAFIFAETHQMPVTVRVDAHTVIIRFRPDELMQLIDSNPIVRHNFITIISNIVIYLTRKIHMLSMFTAKGKLAQYLIEIYKQQQSPVIRLECSRQELADLFGIQKYSLTRAFMQLSDAGIIKNDGRTITIVNPKALFAI